MIIIFYDEECNLGCLNLEVEAIRGRAECITFFGVCEKRIKVRKVAGSGRKNDPSVENSERGKIRD